MHEYVFREREETSRYGLEKLVSRIQKRLDNLKRKLEDLKHHVKILYGILEEISNLPKELRPQINPSTYKSIQDLLKDNTYIREPDKTIEYLKKIYSTIVNNTLSKLFIPKAHQCDTDATSFHREIMRTINTARKHHRGFLALRDILDKVIEDPCEVYSLLYFIDELYEIDENISKVSSDIQLFFQCRMDKHFISVIKEYLLTSQNIQELIKKSKVLKDVSHELEGLRQYKNYSNILSYVNSVSGYSFNTPLTEILHKKIQFKLNSLREYIESSRERACSDNIEPISLEKILTSIHSNIKDTLNRINKLLERYRNNVIKFLKKMKATRSIEKGLELKLSSLAELTHLYKILTEVDTVIEEELKKLPREEKEVLSKILEILAEKDTDELHLETIIKNIDQDHDKLRALTSICEKGILECIVRA